MGEDREVSGKKRTKKSKDAKASLNSAEKEVSSSESSRDSFLDMSEEPLDTSMGDAGSHQIEAVKTDEIPLLVQSLRSTAQSGRTRSKEWRKKQLENIVRMMEENEDLWTEALRADLGKCRTEAIVSEIAFAAGEAREAVSSFKSWMAPQAVSTPMAHLKGLTSCWIEPQPLGLVLIIAPWNYPVNLAISPLIGAIAAGNCAVVKPSEVAPATSKLIASLVARYLDPEAVRVVEGGIGESTALLKERWDHILYTGNGTVGRIVMRAAAEHLTPVTLELGGKSPCVILKDADIAVAARRIAWGKWTNCGQTCIAPDYLLLHEDIADKFLDRLQDQIKQFYTDDPRSSPDYGRIINERHTERLGALLKDIGDGYGKVLCGGAVDVPGRYIAPTILVDVSMDAAVMRDEIFGPILPVFRIRSMDEAISIINGREKPLTLYLFSSSQDAKKRLRKETSSGSLVFNDTLVQFAISSLPFGGVGESGMGAYHGKFSFDCFSHFRSTLDKSLWFDVSVRYPPYSSNKLAVLRKVI